MSKLDPFKRFRGGYKIVSGDNNLKDNHDHARSSFRKGGRKNGRIIWLDFALTWPTSHRRRLPIGLHRDPLRNWVVSDEVMARGEASWLDLVGFGTKLEVNPRLHAEAVLVRARDEYDDIAELMLASWKAAQDTAYRLRRDYAKAGRKS